MRTDKSNIMRIVSIRDNLKSVKPLEFNTKDYRYSNSGKIITDTIYNISNWIIKTMNYSLGESLELNIGKRYQEAQVSIYGKCVLDEDHTLEDMLKELKLYDSTEEINKKGNFYVWLERLYDNSNRYLRAFPIPLPKTRILTEGEVLSGNYSDFLKESIKRIKQEYETNLVNAKVAVEDRNKVLSTMEFLVEDAYLDPTFMVIGEVSHHDIIRYGNSKIAVLVESVKGVKPLADYSYNYSGKIGEVYPYKLHKYYYVDKYKYFNYLSMVIDVFNDLCGKENKEEKDLYIRYAKIFKNMTRNARFNKYIGVLDGELDKWEEFYDKCYLETKVTSEIVQDMYFEYANLVNTNLEGNIKRFPKTIQELEELSKVQQEVTLDHNMTFNTLEDIWWAISTKVGSNKHYAFDMDWYTFYILKAFMRDYIKTHKIQLNQEYINDKDAKKTIATVFQTKKHIPEKVLEVMQDNVFFDIFQNCDYVELDSGIDLNSFEDLQKGVDYLSRLHYGLLLPEVKNKKKIDFRFRLLGKHKAIGLYSLLPHAIIIDPRNTIAFVHEYGHYLDFENTYHIALGDGILRVDMNTHSEKEQFSSIYDRYTQYLDTLPTTSNVYLKLNYYKRPTEVFARAFEYYVGYKLNEIKENGNEDTREYINNFILGVLIRDFFDEEVIQDILDNEQQYAPFIEDMDLVLDVVDYFDNLLGV